MNASRYMASLLALACIAAAPAFAASAAPQWTSALSKLKDASSSQQSSSSSGLLGQLGSGLSLPSIGHSNAGSAAGVLEYCVKNNYLKADSVSSVKDRLLEKAGLSSSSEQYQSGSRGLLSGAGGQNFDLSNLKGKLADKACGYVLKHAKSLL